MQLIPRKRHPVLPFSKILPLTLVLPAILGMSIWAILPEMIPVTGVMEPEIFLALRAPRSGILISSQMDNTKLILAGEVLFHLENRESETERANAFQEMHNAKINLNALEKELREKRARLQLSQETQRLRLSQMEALLESGLKSRLDLDNLRLNYLRDVEADQRQINELEKERLTLSALYEHLVRRATDLDVQLKQNQKLAPWDGYIINGLSLHPHKPFLGTPIRCGDFIEAGRIMGFFGKVNTLALRLSLPDSHRDRIKLGQTVTWSPAGYPHSRYREIRGLLIKIEPALEPGTFWGLVQPNTESISTFLKETGLTIEELWGMGVNARLEVPSRPLWDRVGDR